MPFVIHQGDHLGRSLYVLRVESPPPAYTCVAVLNSHEDRWILLMDEADIQLELLEWLSGKTESYCLSLRDALVREM